MKYLFLFSILTLSSSLNSLDNLDKSPKDNDYCLESIGGNWETLSQPSQQIAYGNCLLSYPECTNFITVTHKPSILDKAMGKQNFDLNFSLPFDERRMRERLSRLGINMNAIFTIGELQRRARHQLQLNAAQNHLKNTLSINTQRKI